MERDDKKQKLINKFQKMGFRDIKQLQLDQLFNGENYKQGISPDAALEAPGLLQQSKLIPDKKKTEANELLDLLLEDSDFNTARELYLYYIVYILPLISVEEKIYDAPWLKGMNNSMDYLYCVCNLFYAITALIDAYFATSATNTILPVLEDIVAAGWNYFDVLGALFIAWSEKNFDEKLQSGLNTFSALQLMLGTLAVNLSEGGLFHANLWALSSTLCVILSGYTFALAMFIPALDAQSKIWQCQQRIASLQSEQNGVLVSPEAEKKIAIQHALIRDYSIDRWSWFFSGVCMTAVSTVAIGTGFGIVFLPFAVSLVAAAKGTVRTWYLQMEKNNISALRFATIHNLTKNRIESIGKLKTVRENTVDHFYNFREYLKKLIESDPWKLKNIIDKIESGDLLDANTAKNELAKHRNLRFFPDVLRGKTRGTKIFHDCFPT